MLYNEIEKRENNYFTFHFNVQWYKYISKNLQDRNWYDGLY